MKYYFLDVENISINRYIKKLKEGKISEKENSNIVLFFNKRTNYAQEDLDTLDQYFENIIFEEMCNGTKNALDFYLVACLSMIAARYNKETYVIISNDKEYSGAIDALRTYIPTATFVQEKIEKEKIIKEKTVVNKYDKVFLTVKTMVEKTNKISNKQDYIKDIEQIIKKDYELKTFEKERQLINQKYGLKAASFNHISKAYQKACS